MSRQSRRDVSKFAMEDCGGSPMVLDPVQPRVALDGSPSLPRIARVQPRPAWWRRRRWQIAGLALLVVIVGVVLSAQRSPAPGPSASPTPSTALIAHGKIMPARQARVGTLGGGVVRQLLVEPGAQVADRTELGRVESATDTEVVTAPFAGVVTNVLVHEGDTLVPGATMVVVADPRTLQAETSDVDEFLVGYVRVGQQLQVTVDTLDNLVLQGTVKSVAGLPQLDANGGQSYPVIVSLGRVPPQVVPGMSIRVTFPELAR
jgi:multidrug efflux pump subunit AcrA (membrane-fusion protein)